VSLCGFFSDYRPPAPFSNWVHPPVRFCSPAEYCRSVSPSPLQLVKAPSLGFRPSSRHHPAASTFTRFPHLALFHSWRFTRLQWFTPPPDLWVYFTPLPRPGFHASGASPSMKPYRLVDGPYPRVVGAGSLQNGCPLCAANRRPAFRACSSPRSVVTPPGFSRRYHPIPSCASPPPGFLSPHRGGAFTSPPLVALTENLVAHALGRPSACSQ